MSDVRSKKDFLGKGWQFPPRLDGRGRIALVEDDRDIEEAIKIILLTRKGERPSRPEFGSELHTLVFAPNDATTSGLARRYTMEALARWEPRIEVKEVLIDDSEAQEGKLHLEINYFIPTLNSERNLVFPFYTIPGE